MATKKAAKAKIAKPVTKWAIVSPRGVITLNMGHSFQTCEVKCLPGERIARVLITELPKRRKAK